MSYQRFSPNFIAALIVKPLRYFFASYAGENLVYSKDMNETKIEIGSVNDFNQIKFQGKPRIIVDRGPFTIKGSGLTDSLAEAPTVGERKGLINNTNLTFISGNSAILVMAREEGVCETIVDMISHFFVWTSPMICDTQHFKSFAMPLAVSPCIVDKEDTEIFKVNISIPWQMEEPWQVRSDSLLIKEFSFLLQSMD